MFQTNFEVSCKLLFHSKPAWIQEFLLKKRIRDRRKADQPKNFEE
jgi:hypothetical protein